MFKDDFLWGAASAAHQIEGAYLDESINPLVNDKMTGGFFVDGDNK